MKHYTMILHCTYFNVIFQKVKCISAIIYVSFFTSHIQSV